MSGPDLLDGPDRLDDGAEVKNTDSTALTAND